MQVTIDLPDDLLLEARDRAARLGISPDELVADALRTYIAAEEMDGRNR